MKLQFAFALVFALLVVGCGGDAFHSAEDAGVVSSVTGGSTTTGGSSSVGSSGGSIPEVTSAGQGGNPNGGVTASSSVGGSDTTGDLVSTGGFVATGGDCAITYYRDTDGDTWGGTEASCIGGLAWVTRTGDCDDRNPDVFPDQFNTFALPYTATNGAQSFDYDCDGVETLASGTQISTGACTASGLGNACVGDGYLPVEPVRQGGNLNQVCGSMRYRVCTRSQQECTGVISTDGSSYQATRCR